MFLKLEDLVKAVVAFLVHPLVLLVGAVDTWTKE